MPLLRVGQGPRASAMGEAFLALSDDATAVAWNPAGLGRVADFRLALSHQQWFAGIRDELLHTAIPLGPGALGAGLVFSHEPGVEQWLPSGEPGDTFSTWHGVASLGYGMRLGDYSFGAAARGFYEDLFESVQRGVAFDLGFAARPAPFVSVAAACRNVGFTEQELPLDFGLAGALLLNRLGPSLPDLRLTADALYAPGSGPALKCGAEYLPVSPLSLRLGYRTGPADLAALGPLGGLTAGVGVSVGGFELGYCVAPYGKLGLTHRVGHEAVFAGEAPGSLRLRVIDAETGRPLGADVTLFGSSELNRRLGRTGELHLTRLKPGTLFIHTGHTGYEPRADTMQITGAREQTATIALRKSGYGTITGTVYDAATGRPVSGAVTYRGPAFGTAPADPEQGVYTCRSLPAGPYQVTAAGPDEDYISQTCTLSVETGRTTRRDFRLLRHRQPMVLEGVNFETGKADILERFLPVLKRAEEILGANPDVQVEVSGHTDPREINTEQFPSNWELSQARAEAVRRWLVEHGNIAPERLEARGYADTKPVAPNNSEEGLARNRRVEFRVISE